MKRNHILFGAVAVVLAGALSVGAYELGRQSGMEVQTVTPAESLPAAPEQQPAMSEPEPSRSEPAEAPASLATSEAPLQNLEAMFPAVPAQPSEKTPAVPAVSQPAATPTQAVSVSASTPAADIPDGVISFDAGYAGSGTPIRPDPPASGKRPVTTADGADSETETESQEEADGSFDYDLESFAAEVLRLTNEARAEAGVGSLDTDPVLSEMAQARMDEKNGGLSHTRPDGTTPDTIFDEYDTALTCTGEIIMSTARSPKAVVDGFLSGAAHRRNLLNPDHQYVGIGVEWGETPAGPGIAVLELFAK